MNVRNHTAFAPSRTLASVVVAVAALTALAGCERRATDPQAPMTGGTSGGSTTTTPPATPMPPASAASR